MYNSQYVHANEEATFSGSVTCGSLHNALAVSMVKE